MDSHYCVTTDFSKVSFFQISILWFTLDALFRMWYPSPPFYQLYIITFVSYSLSFRLSCCLLPSPLRTNCSLFTLLWLFHCLLPSPSWTIALSHAHHCEHSVARLLPLPFWTIALCYPHHCGVTLSCLFATLTIVNIPLLFCYPHHCGLNKFVKVSFFQIFFHGPHSMLFSECVTHLFLFSIVYYICLLLNVS